MTAHGAAAATSRTITVTHQADVPNSTAAAQEPSPPDDPAATHSPVHRPSPPKHPHDATQEARP